LIERCRELSKKDFVVVTLYTPNQPVFFQTTHVVRLVGVKFNVPNKLKMRVVSERVK